MKLYWYGNIININIFIHDIIYYTIVDAAVVIHIPIIAELGRMFKAIIFVRTGKKIVNNGLREKILVPFPLMHMVL